MNHIVTINSNTVLGGIPQISHTLIDIITYGHYRETICSMLAFVKGLDNFADLVSLPGLLHAHVIYVSNS